MARGGAAAKSANKLIRCSFSLEWVFTGTMVVRGAALGNFRAYKGYVCGGWGLVPYRSIAPAVLPRIYSLASAAAMPSSTARRRMYSSSRGLYGIWKYAHCGTSPIDLLRRTPATTESARARAYSCTVYIYYTHYRRIYPVLRPTLFGGRDRDPTGGVSHTFSPVKSEFAFGKLVLTDCVALS
jgi:hypothetical protein